MMTESLLYQVVFEIDTSSIDENTVKNKRNSRFFSEKPTKNNDLIYTSSEIHSCIYIWKNSHSQIIVASSIRSE